MPRTPSWSSAAGARATIPSRFPFCYDNKVFVSTGQDPEHGEGPGCIWCIDATRKLDGSDVSPHKVVDSKGNVIPHRRITNLHTWHETRCGSAVVEESLDKSIVSQTCVRVLANQDVSSHGMTVKPVVPGTEWELISGDVPPETMYVWKRPHINAIGKRENTTSWPLPAANGSSTIPTPPRSGNTTTSITTATASSTSRSRCIAPLAAPSSPTACCFALITAACYLSGPQNRSAALDLRYARRLLGHAAHRRWPAVRPDEDGDIAIFHPSAAARQAGDGPQAPGIGNNGPAGIPTPPEINMGNSVYCTPVAANGVLYIATKDRLFAIQTTNK